MERPILKALSIPEILDKVLQLYRRHAGLLLMIGAIIFIPYAAISSVFVFYFNDARLATSALSMILPPFAYLALTFAMSNLYLGKDVTIREAFSAGTKRFWSWIGTGLLMGLAMTPVGMVIGAFSLGGTGLAIVGLLIFIPVVVFLTTRWSLARSMVVLENTGASKSMGRSWSLTEDYFWRVFGTSFAAGLLSMLLSTLPSLFVAYLLRQFTSIPINLSTIITTVVEQLTTIIASPLIMGVSVLIYYDLRIRKEGFDLMFMAEEQIEHLETV